MAENEVITAVGIDAGGARTRTAVCVLENGCIRFAGAGEAASRGWVRGRIADQNALSESVAASARAAEAHAGVPVETAVVGIGGPTVRGANSRAVVEIGRPREVEQRDVNRLVDRAARVQLQEDRMVLQVFPQDFVVDDHPGHRDPRGMLGSRLEANVHLITASQQEHTVLVGAINQAHLSADETVFEGIAAAYATVLADERREGIAIIDIGAQSTDLAVYFGDALQLASSIPISGDHFTRDVARGLHLGFEDAEIVKEDYGCALAEATAEHSVIDVPSPRGPRETTRRFLAEILQARAVELFQYVQKELQRVGMDRALFGGVVLTGGGARLAGMCDVAEKILGCEVRNGLPVGIENWPESLNSPEWSTAAGLAMYSARLQLNSRLKREQSGVLARILK